MDRSILEVLAAQGKSSYTIADELSCSQTNIRYFLKKYNIRTRLSRNDFFMCKTCGETDECNFIKTEKNKRSKTKCKKCHGKYTVERFRENKNNAVLYKGGKCCRCGYSKCAGSLHFHHEDPKKKDPNWKRMRIWKLDKIKDELDKCILLCGNCHGEEHWLRDE